MAIKRKYRLNLRNYGNLPAIMLSQYDEGYAIEFEIRDGTDAASDLSAYTVTLKGTRADTLAYSFAGTVSTNVLTFVIDTTMTACDGRGTAEIAIKDTANDVLFATFNMPVFVERAAVPEGSIDADVERAQEIAEQVQEIVDNAAAAVSGAAEKWATGQINGTDVPSTDPTYENNAKYYAEQAETAAESIGIDATLTQAGKAADSKKTGDKITALKEDLTQVSEKSGVSETSVTVDSSDVRDGWPSTSIGATAQIGGSSTKTKTIVNAVAVEGGKIYKFVITNGETVTLVSSRSIVFTNSQSKIVEYVNYTNRANANESTTVIYTPVNDGYVWISVDYTYASVVVYELEPVYTALDAVSRGYLYENIIKNVLNPNDVLVDQCSGISVGSNIESVAARNGYISTKPISVRAGERYIFNAQGYLTNIIYANANKIIVSNHVLTAGEAFTIPDDVYFMQYSFAYNNAYMNYSQWKDRVMLIKGESIPTYYLPYNKFAIATGTSVLSPIATMTGRKKKAYIILNFDASEDATTGMFTYRKSIMDQYGLKGCPCLTKTALNNSFNAWASEVNRQQYFDMIKEGWDFGLYVSERGDSMTESQWDTFLTSVKAGLESLGVYNLVGFHCTGNNLTTDLYNALKTAGFKIVRCTANTFQPTIYMPLTITDETLIPIATTAMQGEATSAAIGSIKTIINNAIASNSVLSIMTHLVLDTDDTIDEWNCHLSMFIEVLDYIKAKVDSGEIEVITWRELYQKMNPHDSNEYDYNRLLKMGIFAQS